VAAKRGLVSRSSVPVTIRVIVIIPPTHPFIVLIKAASFTIGSKEPVTSPFIRNLNVSTPSTSSKTSPISRVTISGASSSFLFDLT